MSAQEAGWTPRLVISRPAGERTGRVVSVEPGVVHVLSRGRSSRATIGAALLAETACNQDAAPRPGDRVRLRTWPDGPVTVERVLARAVPPGQPPSEQPGPPPAQSPGDLLG